MALIDRDELYNHLENAKWEHDFKDGHAPWNLGVKVQTIANMTTIDAVEVVRCKDCKWWIPEKIEKTEWYTSETGAHCGRVDSVNVHGYREGEPSHDTTLLWMSENSFCSYGERK